MNEIDTSKKLSPWWRHAVILTLIIGFTILIWLAIRTYKDAPPIPEAVVSESGDTIFTKEDIMEGQQIFLKYGLMENGSIWGHGAYLGPDFSAEYLHTLSLDVADWIASKRFHRSFNKLTDYERYGVTAEVQRLLKQNRYDKQSKTLTFTEPEVISYRK